MIWIVQCPRLRAWDFWSSVVLIDLNCLIIMAADLPSAPLQFLTIPSTKWLIKLIDDMTRVMLWKLLSFHHSFLIPSDVFLNLGNAMALRTVPTAATSGIAPKPRRRSFQQRLTPVTTTNSPAGMRMVKSHNTLPLPPISLQMDVIFHCNTSGFFF